MGTKFDYTTKARTMAFRFPVYSFISTQVNYWILAFILFSSIVHFTARTIDQVGMSNIDVSFGMLVLISVIIGVIFGVVLGYVELLEERTKLRHLSLGLIILIRMAVYPLLLFGIMSLLRFVVWDYIIEPTYPGSKVVAESEITWRNLTIILLIFTAPMSAIISFINQMNNKFGPGVLIPMLLGRYRTPKEQERFFMFLDLKSSTAHAENLGHIKYSAMIRDSFMDINRALSGNNAEVYQYVGDEVVITWLVAEGIRKLSCIKLFFDVRELFYQRRSHYLSRYGFVPEFKAGLHLGKITAVEVGEIKRDIAYHGDTINTAARIQGLCNELQRSFIVSSSVENALMSKGDYTFTSLGEKSLKGKNKQLELYSVDCKQLLLK
jgi:adenylate cyclase